MKQSKSGEFELIAQLGEILNTRDGVMHSLGDDCAHLASLQAPVVSVDALVENIHFRRDWLKTHGQTQSLGWKTLAVSVSDLASSGAFPVAAFVALGVPKNGDLEWVREVYRGMEKCAQAFDFTVAGGDTTGSPVWTLTATLIGELMPEAQRKPILRSGARAGDLICVTRDLGASGAALELLKREKPLPEEVKQAHFSPQPETGAMRALLKRGRENIHAALDLSDGLGSDAFHLAAQSGVRFEIECEKLPISDATRKVARELEIDAINLALGGGEDYALLVCCEKWAPGMIEIGRVTSGAGVYFLENGCERASQIGWRHF